MSNEKSNHVTCHVFSTVKWHWSNAKLCFKSLLGNQHLDQNYASDVCMEPMFWFVDNFTKFLGPLFVCCVVALMAAVIAISYWIGLPYWWERSPPTTVALLLFGHWLLVNTLFHYYMGVVTSPGFPPLGALIPEAVSMCKKCIAPKPPRTHHCSVCDRCVLKMDHHCPWLNNCVGHFNHRYFFMYMIFIVLSTLFIMVFGFDIAYTEVWLGDQEFQEEEEQLDGHPVRFNNSVMIAVIDGVEREMLSEDGKEVEKWKRKAIIFMAFICSGVFVALGMLSYWHARLIARGETSIEANINKAERKRLSALNKIHVNPYDFGARKNWRLFLGNRRGRLEWCRRVLLPSWYQPFGNGLTWQTVHEEEEDSSHQKQP